MHEPNSSPVNIDTIAAKLLAILGQSSLILVWKRPFFFQIKIFFIESNSSPAKNNSFLIRSYSFQIVFPIPDNILQLSLCGSLIWSLGFSVMLQLSAWETYCKFFVVSVI